MKRGQAFLARVGALPASSDAGSPARFKLAELYGLGHSELTHHELVHGLDFNSIGSRIQVLWPGNPCTHQHFCAMEQVDLDSIVRKLAFIGAPKATQIDAWCSMHAHA